MPPPPVVPLKGQECVARKRSINTRVSNISHVVSVSFRLEAKGVHSVYEVYAVFASSVSSVPSSRRASMRTLDGVGIGFLCMEPYI